MSVKLIHTTQGMLEGYGFANEVSLTTDNWVKISPYGDFEYKRNGQKQIQRFDRTAADEMVYNFKTFGNVKSLLRGIPLYIGHPDSEDAKVRAEYPDRRAYGRYKQLEARDDGLFGKLFAGEEGKSIINEGQLTYLSPHWYSSDKPIARENGIDVFRPIWLASVGLTDDPNIKTAAPLPYVNTRPTNTTQPKEKQMDRAMLIFVAGLLGFANEAPAAGDDIPAAFTEKVRTGLQTMKTEAAKVAGLTNDFANEKRLRQEDITKLTGERDGHKTSFDNERKGRIADALKDAVDFGRIPAAEKADWERRLGVDFTNELAALRNLPVKLKLVSMTNARPGARNVADPEGGVAKITSLISEEYAKLPANMKHAKRHDLAFANAKAAHPEVFGAKTSEDQE